MRKIANNPISNAWVKYQNLDVPPLLEALGIGALAWGGTKLLWHPVADTIMALGSFPMKAAGMTDDDLAETSEMLHTDPTYQKWVPAGIAALAGLSHIGLNWRGNERWNGLASHNGAVKATKGDKDRTWKQDLPGGGMSNNSSFDDMSNGFVMYNDMDSGQRINGQQTLGLFQDPHLTPYSSNMGTAIVNNAMNVSGVSNPTMGNIFDSAVDKFKTKLTFGGLAEVGVKTVVANSMANLFASALGTMAGIPQNVQNNIVQAGTWAGAINAIMN